MHVKAHLDVDLVAVQQTDVLTLMLELEAPVPTAGSTRPDATVVVVLDRSGSMGDGRLEAAKTALAALVDRLAPQGRLGLVTFDEEVEVVLPAGPVTDKPALEKRIADIETGGMTNLSGGLLRGIQEARRVAGPTGATVVLLSDGHANHGVTDPAKLEAVAQRAGVTLSTVGLGLGYDEDLLGAIARGGRGDHVFAEGVDAAGPALAAQVDGLLSKSVQAASLLIRPIGAVEGVELFNDLPGQGVEGGVMVELGDLWAGEQRTLLVGLHVPAMPGLGLAEVASLELHYVALPGLVEETVTLPVFVNVVPGDEAAGRIANPKVRQELLFQQAQRSKREAMDDLSRGDVAGAAMALRGAAGFLPSEHDEERDVLLSMAAEAEQDDAVRARKRMAADSANKSRRRGRGR
jgi:Ca-activated chloride channel family protein